MATAASVLAVIRAARPTFRSAHDRIAFVVHSAFLASGYSLTAVGPAAGAAFSSFSESPADAEETEVGIEGWNELDDGSYAFQYSGGNQPGLCKSVIVKCTAIGYLLMVDAAALPDADTTYSLEIKVRDYAVDSMTNNYAQQFTNLEELVERINSSIISKLSSSAAGSSSEPTKSPPTLIEREVILPSRSSILEEPLRTGRFTYPEVPAYGGSDLLPGFGGGVLPPRRDAGVGVGGSMLVGPNDPRWGRMGVGNGQPPLGGPNPPGVPPGARFDPFGPPGVPGFEPDRFTMPRRPPGGTHPDLEHFSPF